MSVHTRRRRIFRAPKFRNPPQNPITDRALAYFVLQEANDSHPHPPMSVWSDLFAMTPGNRACVKKTISNQDRQ
jgi:hypothetical protein